MFFSFINVEFVCELIVNAQDTPISPTFLKAGQIGADYAFERTRLYSLYASEGKSGRCADFTRRKKDTRITSPIIIYM